MTTYNTGNPLGSAAVKDLFDNAQNLDIALNSNAVIAWSDRLKRNRRTFWGMEQEHSAQMLIQKQRFNIFIQSSGYQVTGNYTDGPLTISDYNQLVRYNGELWKLNPSVDVPFSTSGNDSSSWLADSASFSSVADAYLRQELASDGGSGLIGDLFRPVTWSGFSGGADKSGATDSSAVFDEVYSGANSSGLSIFIPAGEYNVGGEIRKIGSDSIWLSRDFNSGVSISSSAQKTPFLITVGNPDEPVMDAKHTRNGLVITAIGRGAQHIDCIRASLINYSTDGQGNTAVYASASSIAGSMWSAALHGETKHNGGTTIGISSETATYSTSGSAYGAVINNTSGSAASVHPSTGDAVTAHPTATALYITGGNTRGEMGQWVRGIRFSPLSMRANGSVFRDESSCDKGYWSLSGSSKTTADILLEGSAPYGIILNGKYSSGNAVRLNSGAAIAYEATGSVKTKYDGANTRWGVFNGDVEKVGFNTATPGMYFNGVRVVAGQQAAINNAAAGTEVSTINRILSAMRNHGLIAA